MSKLIVEKKEQNKKTMPDKLTKNETEILEQIRDLKPYETIQIMADAQGRPSSFLITRR